MVHDLKNYLREGLPRDLLLDLYDMLGAQALKAFEMVRDHAGLDEKRSRELIGQARFRMMEKGFVDVCLFHGGQLLPEGIIPGTSLRAFQPFVRLEYAARGIVLGLASMSAPQELPGKNRSRIAGVVLNQFLSPRLDLGDISPQPGDVFVVLVVARDRARSGMIEEVAIGVIDSDYTTYLEYEPLEKFLSGYVSEPNGPGPTDGGGPGSGGLVRLKQRRGVFSPPEAGAGEAKRDGNESA